MTKTPIERDTIAALQSLTLKLEEGRCLRPLAYLAQQLSHHQDVSKALWAAESARLEQVVQA